MSRPRRYAEGTTVAAEASQAEIRLLLTKHGVVIGRGDQPEVRPAIEFVLNGYRYRFTVERPADEWARKNAGPREDRVR